MIDIISLQIISIDVYILIMQKRAVPISTRVMHINTLMLNYYTLLISGETDQIYLHTGRAQRMYFFIVFAKDRLLSDVLSSWWKDQYSICWPLIIAPAQQSCWGGILVSLRPSIRLIPPHTTKLLGGILVSLVRPSICLSVCLSRILCWLCSTFSSGWILFIFIILSSNFRRCKVSCKFQNLIFLPIFQNLKFWLCLVLTWDLMWITRQAF